MPFEQRVFYEIAPKIIDSLYHEVREIYPKLVQEFSDENVDLNKKENLPFLVVGIVDSIYDLGKSEDSKFIHHFSEEKVDLDTSNTAKTIKLEISRIKSSDIFNFKKLSQIPTGPRRWKKTEDFFLRELLASPELGLIKSVNMEYLRAV
ncbi:hypothetical protein [Maribacter halichondriae]|uniref:hypothetical protein n=1 Tax=Maribacter halichondriae TaxID=2980554 RepID=UPI0023586CE3|nr:hypothetical protein [Maribacter sp. Hal144]